MIKNQITLKQLEALVCVVDEGGFRRAAEVLGTTQPNISVRIASLEETLGAVLLLRDPGSVQLTAQGRDILSAARDVLRATERLVATAGRPDLIQNRLRLGVTELIAATWLHDFLRTFGAAYPAVRVELTIDVAQVIARSLDVQDLDLGILNEVGHQKSHENVPLTSDRYIWVAAPGVAQSLPNSATLADLFEHPVLMHGRHTQASQALRAAAKEHRLGADRIAHSNSLTACLTMVGDGMGVGLLPSQLCKPALDAGKVVEIPTDWQAPELEFVASFDAERVPYFVTEAADMAAQIARR